jgi:hypothetical protein
MKTINITQVAVEFPNQTTSVSLQIVEKTGIITEVQNHVTLDIPGIYQTLNSELFNIILTELNNAGYNVQAGIPEDSLNNTSTNTTTNVTTST